MRFSPLCQILLALGLTNVGSTLPTEPTEDSVPYPLLCSDIDFSHSNFIDSEPINCIKDFSSMNPESAPRIDFWEVSNLTSNYFEPESIIDDFNNTSSADSTPPYSNETTRSIQRRSPRKGQPTKPEPTTPYRSDFPSKSGLLDEPVELDPVLNAPGVLSRTYMSNNEFRQAQDATYQTSKRKWKDWFKGNCGSRVKYEDNHRDLRAGDVLHPAHGNVELEFSE
ncbi:hypothetical protein ACEPPN_009152 [Leptodophora sp. 'Broadleaf-Isolate-01']